MTRRPAAPVLVVVGGLPATGKSTVASALARQAGFIFVRVDRIEQAIIDSAGLRQPLGPVGYTVAYGGRGHPRRDPRKSRSCFSRSRLTAP